MTRSSSPPGQVAVLRPGRPRGDGAHHAILGATLDLLAERGYAGLTIEEAAQRAHVAKAGRRSSPS